MTSPDSSGGSVSLDKAAPREGAVEPAAQPVDPAPVAPVVEVEPASSGSAVVGPEPAAGRTAAPGRANRLAWLAAVVLVTAALAAVAVLLAVRARDARETASYYTPSSAPLSAARAAGRALFSYDYKTIDKDFAAARALTTGTFTKEYATTTQSVVRPVAVENKAVVKANTYGEGIARAEPGRVVVLVFVNQVTTSTKVTGEKLDSSRVRMTLVERDGRWRVSKVDAL